MSGNLDLGISSSRPIVAAQHLKPQFLITNPKILTVSAAK